MMIIYHVGYMVYEECQLFEFIPILMLNTTPVTYITHAQCLKT